MMSSVFSLSNVMRFRAVTQPAEDRPYVEDGEITQNSLSLF